jgi:hypothetical protein
MDQTLSYPANLPRQAYARNRVSQRNRTWTKGMDKRGQAHIVVKMRGFGKMSVMPRTARVASGGDGLPRARSRCRANGHLSDGKGLRRLRSRGRRAPSRRPNPHLRVLLDAKPLALRLVARTRWRSVAIHRLSRGSPYGNTVWTEQTEQLGLQSTLRRRSRLSKERP